MLLTLLEVVLRAAARTHAVSASSGSAMGRDVAIVIYEDLERLRGQILRESNPDADLADHPATADAAALEERFTRASPEMLDGVLAHLDFAISLLAPVPDAGEAEEQSQNDPPLRSLLTARAAIARFAKQLTPDSLESHSDLTYAGRKAPNRALPVGV